MARMDAARSENLEQCSDAELVRLLVTGNRDAMTVIFDRYYRLVMSVALRMLHDVGAAEDVVQIVFTRFYQTANLFDETKGNLGTWLLQYAYGRTINHKRSLNSRRFYEQAASDENELDSPSATYARPLGLDTRDAARLVEQILPSLNEKQRFVIERVFFEGMKVSEVAAETGESIGNIQHAYYRGIDKLRAYLREKEKKSSVNPTLAERPLFWLRRTRKDSEPLREEAQIAKSRIL
jgi:RNA polymerase sigma-70 factor (ECF subfamily)